MTMNAEAELIDTLHRGFIARHPAEAAQRLESMDPAEAAGILERQSDAALPLLWERFSPHAGAEFLKRVDRAVALQVLNRMEPTRAAAVLASLDGGDREGYVSRLDRAIQRDLRLILSYPPDSAGALMDPRVIYLHRDMTASEALGRLRQQKRSMRPIRARRILLLADAEGRLDGMVEIQDLALSDPQAPLARCAQPVTAWVDATASKEEMVDKMEEHRLSSLPVVDADGRLIGVVRYEELVAAAREEAVSDMQIMFGVSREERALSPARFAIRKRLPWLEVNLATAFLAASVVGLFEHTIAQYTALAVLLPVVAGQSGNTGAQALAVVIRGLALREIRITQWRRVLLKELNVGLVNGIAVALTTAAGVYIWSGSLGLTLIIGIAMVISMAVASMAGALIPIMLTVAGQDPAQSSSIFLTTVTDVSGFFSFLGIATALLWML
jgi:magnesium transporter